MEHNNYTNNSNKTQVIRKKHFNHLTLADRQNIEYLLSLKMSKDYKGPKITVAYIASYIGVSKSTVSREIKRGTYRDMNPTNGKSYDRYLASYGDGTSKKNSKRSHYKRKLKKDSEELKELTALLNQGADPLTALTLYKKKHGRPFPLSEKSIYNYFHRGDLVLKRGAINPRKRHKKAKKEAKMVHKGESIDNRSEIINNREELGHWEGDLIVGPRDGSTECLFTLMERKSRLYLAFKLANKEMKSVVEMLDNIENKISPEGFRRVFKSITFDNGSEFKDTDGMLKSINLEDIRTSIFYTHPYCSFEKGSNENGNRMMRKYYHKGTSFKDVTEKEILEATNKINYSVRKLLGNKTAADTLKELDETFFAIIELLGVQDPYIGYLNS